MASDSTQPENHDNGNKAGDNADQTHQELCQKIGEAERRKKQAREKKEATAWVGLGTFGLVGWSVTIPVLIGIAAGLWLDANWQATFSWTLTFMFVGFVVGCLNAWYWVTREGQEIEQETVTGRREDGADNGDGD